MELDDKARIKQLEERVTTLENNLIIVTAALFKLTQKDEKQGMLQNMLGLFFI